MPISSACRSNTSRSITATAVVKQGMRDVQEPVAGGRRRALHMAGTRCGRRWRSLLVLSSKPRLQGIVFESGKIMVRSAPAKAKSFAGSRFLCLYSGSVA